MLRIAICEDEEVHKKILVDLIERYPFKTDYLLTTFQYGYELVEASKKGMRFFYARHLINLIQIRLSITGNFIGERKRNYAN